MTETHVSLVHGAPGCGKTHTLLDAVEQHVDEDDLGMFDLFLANFTNNGREATADDLIGRGVFDLTEYPDDITEDDLRRRCRTLHSIALSCCPEITNPQEQVITMDTNGDVYEAFCTEHGLAFEPEETNPLELIQNGSESKPRGNKLFALNEWLHAKYLPSADRLAKVTEAPIDIALANSRLRDLLQAWQDYKQTPPDLYEHHDYIDLCIEHGHVPDIKFLAIDEFQDLSPVEYAVFKQWRDSGQLDWIYIAGDVNQSIYSFRCASPYYLSHTAVDERDYLTDSYRCPSTVSSVARGILKAEPAITRNIFRTATRGAGYTPTGTARMRAITDGEGLAHAVRGALDIHDQPDGDETAAVYLLTRTNWQLGILSNALQQHGVPFDAIGDKMDPWPEKVVDCLIALRALRRESPAPREPAETLLDIATNSDLRKQRFAEADAVTRQFRVDLESDPVYFPERLKAAFPGRSPRTIVDVLDLTDYQQDMLRGALETDAAPYPDQVQVGTIHEAKGLQAPCVFLFTETSETVLDRYQDDVARAEEHRIYYVGATRASESLHVVDGFFDGPIHPIFETGLPGHSEPDTSTDSHQGVAD